MMPINDCQYRTEIYLQQRERNDQTNSDSSNMTTWKELTHQKHMIEHDRIELDRALSRINSIHDSLNRSSIYSSARIYSILYSNHDDSDRLLQTFCQRHDHYRPTYFERKELIFNGFRSQFNPIREPEDSDTDNDIDDLQYVKPIPYDSEFDSDLPIG